MTSLQQTQIDSPGWRHTEDPRQLPGLDQTGFVWKSYSQKQKEKVPEARLMRMTGTECCSLGRLVIVSKHVYSLSKNADHVHTHIRSHVFFFFTYFLLGD